MRCFKNRTLALVVASVITVVGSFAADKYKNSLMGLDFQINDRGVINMAVQTKLAYPGNVNPIQKDANTYILMLPEMDSAAQTPKLDKTSGIIESVNIKTMPYSQNGNGYTRIVIKTNTLAKICGTNQIFIPAKEEPKSVATKVPQDIKVDNAPQKTAPPKKYSTPPQDKRVSVPKQAVPQRAVRPKYNQTSTAQNTTTPVVESAIPATEDPFEKVLLGMGMFLLSLCLVFFFIRAKNKLAELAGEKLDISVDDEEKSKENNKTDKVKTSKSTAAPTPSVSPSFKSVSSDYSADTSGRSVSPEAEDASTIVDLDELFQDKQAVQEDDNSEEENLALEEFLREFSFMEEEPIPEEEVGPGYDEAEYEKVMQNNTLRFDKNDLAGIWQLLGLEISDEVIQNIEEYAVTNPIKKKPSMDQILEKLVTDYKIGNDINFTSDDIKIMKKLISVELDPDFVTDLRTNPNLVKRMQKRILEHSNEPQKSSQTIVLKVKDMLPDLAAELAARGTSNIEYEGKPEAAVYVSEGYEVSTLKVNSLLPDLSKEIYNEDANKFKPSAEVPIVDTSYEHEKLKVGSILPDLQDVLAHPEKYKEPEKEDVVVDEEALLNSIMNVQFKNFDEGKEFEVLNDINDEEGDSTPTVWDIQKELNQFENFSVAGEFDADERETAMKENMYDPDSNDVDSNRELEVTEPDLNNFDNNDLPISQDMQVETAMDEEPVVNNELVKTVSADIINDDKPSVVEDFDISSIQADDQADIVKEQPEKNESLQVERPAEQQKEREQEVPKPKNNNTAAMTASLVAPKNISQERDKAFVQKPVQSVVNINKLRQERAVTANNQIKQIPVAKMQQSSQTVKFKCIIDGVNYNVIDTVSFGQNMGCHLAKNENGYAVLAYSGEKLNIIKHYASISIEKIQARLNDKDFKGAPRYLVKVGINKFIVDVNDNQVCYVMDLC